MADEHRIRARGDRLRRFDDPTTSDDPRVVAVLEQLSTAATEYAAITPRADFRAELRTQLVAITPRLVAEYAPTHAGSEISTKRASADVAVLDRPRPSPRPQADEPSTREARTPRRTFWQSLRTLPIGRPLAVVASLVTVLALVLGGSVYLSQDAVPGDTLYGLKRASERFELSLADTDSERAQKHLEFAGTRVDEARELVTRVSSSAAGTGPLAGASLSPETSARVTEALDSANSDTQTASRLLGGVAVDSASPAPLSTLTEWAPQQLNRLAELRAAVPSGTAANTAVSQSFALLQTAKARATTLQKRVTCNCLKDSPTDAYGPLPTPAPVVTAPRTQTPALPTTPGSTRTTPKAPGSAGTTPATGSSPGKSSTSRRPLLPLPSLRLPSNTQAPTDVPRIDLCKVNLLGIRLCPSPTK